MSDLARLPASLWQRIKAFAFDYLIIAGYLMLTVLLGVGINLALPNVSQAFFANRYNGQVISSLLVTLSIALYFPRQESSSQQATWGKRKIGVRVIRTDGSPLTFARALGRTLLKFVPWELSHTLIWQLRFAQSEVEPLILAGFVLVWLLVGANVVSCWLSGKHQTIYDKMSDTYVVKVSPVQSDLAPKMLI